MKLTKRERDIVIDVCNLMAEHHTYTCALFAMFSDIEVSDLTMRYIEFFGQSNDRLWDWDSSYVNRHGQRLMCLATFLVLEGEVP